MSPTGIAFRSILVPTDFGEPAKHALEIALALAAKFDAKVTLLHACWMPPWTYRRQPQLCGP
mgnify:CR=1 FL=1